MRIELFSGMRKTKMRIGNFWSVAERNGLA